MDLVLGARIAEDDEAEPCLTGPGGGAEGQHLAQGSRIAFDAIVVDGVGHEAGEGDDVTPPGRLIDHA